VSVVALPAAVRVIVRDWVNANHVVFLGSSLAALIDAGHVCGADETLERVGHALGERPLARLLLTHCHSDHMGGCARVRARFGCRIAVPEGDVAAIRAWDTEALWLDYAGQMAEPFPVDDVLRPGERLELGDLEWDVIPAPGHDMGAVVFWNPSARILISGDALWEQGFGIVLPGEGWRDRFAAARDCLHRLRALRPRVVIPGHGQPFAEADTAIDRCLARIDIFERDEPRLARHALQVMVAYSLMQHDGLAEPEALRRFAAVPMFVEYAREYFGQPPYDVVSELLKSLLAKGAVTRGTDGLLRAR
jgi:glyoxylase-like metal-dependent hydrolase (beta-lactamase superfamily II)